MGSPLGGKAAQTVNQSCEQATGEASLYNHEHDVVTAALCLPAQAGDQVLQHFGDRTRGQSQGAWHTQRHGDTDRVSHRRGGREP